MIIIRLLMLLALLGTVNPVQAGPILIKISVSYNPKDNPNSPHVLAMQTFQQELEKFGQGKIRSRIFWNDRLAPSYDQAVSYLLTNIIHVTQVPNSFMTRYTKAGIPFSDFFMFPYPNYNLIHQIIDGRAGDLIRQRASKEAGLHILSFWELGFRHFTSIDKPINTLNDLKQYKLRIQPFSSHKEGFQALGAIPVPIHYDKLYNTLQLKQVDGSENPLTNIIDAKLYEVQNYLTLSGHVFEFANIVMSEKFYNSLPPDIQSCIQMANYQATQVYRKQFAASINESLEFLKTKMTIYSLPSDELKKFQASVISAQKTTRNLADPDYYDDIKAEIELVIATSPRL